MPNPSITETDVSEAPDGTIVKITIADNPSLDDATEWIQFQVPVDCEHSWSLAAIQRLALDRIRDVISAEIQRTARIANLRSK